MTTNFRQLDTLAGDIPRIGRAGGTVAARPEDSRFERVARKTRIVILGAGFGGTYLAIELERLSKRRDVEVTLISRDNFYLMTPLLFEAASGSVEVRHVVNPIRPMLSRTRFVRAEVTHVDFERRVVSAQIGGDKVEVPYDQLVVALGGAPRYDLVPGARHALAFKTIEDAIALRTHVLDAFERATLERDRALRERLLRLVVVGGGLVGVELAGEMWHFLESLRKTYTTIGREEVSVHIVQAGPTLAPELDPSLRAYIEKTYARRGIRVHTGVAVQRIEPGEIDLGDSVRMSAGTIVYAAGLAVSPLVATFPVDRDHRGRIVTDASMRSVSHRDVWALGDNAAVPIPDLPGQTYPALSQHAHREAKALARNLMRADAGEQAQPFAFHSPGTAALLGGRRAVVNAAGVHIRGFVAWLLWRSLFLLRVPSWQRRLRLVADWTVALLFPADSAQVRLPAQVGAPPASEPASVSGPASSLRTA